jgi:predicted Zn-dependent protease
MSILLIDFFVIFEFLIVNYMNLDQLLSELNSASSSENFELLEKLSAEALRNYPEESVGYRFLADALINRENIPFDAVEQCLIKLIQLNENDVDAVLKYARVKELQGDFEESIKAFRKVITKDPKNIEALIAVAEHELYALGRISQSLVYLDYASEIDPYNNQIKCMKAEAYIALKRYADALIELDAVILKGFDENAYQLKVQLLTELDRSSATIPLLRELTNRNPVNLAYHFQLAKNLLLIHDYSGAESSIHQMLKISENQDSEVYKLLSDSYKGQSKFKEAEEAIKKAIDKAPDLFDLQIDRVMILKESKQFQAALEFCSSLFGQNPVFEEDLSILKAEILLDLGKWQEGEEIYLKYLNIKGFEKNAAYGLGRIANEFEADFKKAYFYMHQSESRGNEKAGIYINQKLKGYLDFTVASLLDENQSFIKENKNNPVLQDLFGRFWHFEKLSSKSLENASDELRSFTLKKLENKFLYLTEKGLMMSLGSGRIALFTYKIKAVYDNQLIDLEFIPLDGLQRFIVRLQLTNNGLVFTQTEGEYILLKSKDNSNLSEDLKSFLQNGTKNLPIKLLGDSMNKLIEEL